MSVHSGMSVHSALLVVYLAVGLLVGLVAHEYAHALVAVRLGDHSPRLQGRLTLNPRPHIDPFGTIVLPAILLLVVLFDPTKTFVFAYAKPMELNPWILRRRQAQALWIALAGPAANVLVAFVLGGAYRLVRVSGGEVRTFIGACLLANVILAAMNLMPIPPLDGARIVTLYLPPRPAEVMRNLEQYGALFMIVIFFIISGPIITFAKAIGNGICQIVVGGRCFL